MATPDEIRIQAQTLSGTPVDKSTALIWIQEQIRTLVYDHFRACDYVIEKIQISEDGGDYSPERTIVVLDRVINGNGYKYRGWTLNKNVITFENAGAYTIKYYAMPIIPATSSTTIDMPDPYVSALKYFLASRIRARYMGQNDVNAVSFFEEYSSALKNADIVMKRMTSRHKTMPPGRRTL